MTSTSDKLFMTQEWHILDADILGSVTKCLAIDKWFKRLPHGISILHVLLSCAHGITYNSGWHASPTMIIS